MTLKNDLDLARGYLPKDIYKRIVESFESRLSIPELRKNLIEAIDSHSRKHTPLKLEMYIEAWNEMDGVELPLTSHLREAILSRIESKAFLDIRQAEAEYWNTRRPAVEPEDMCRNCSNPFPEGRWSCMKCQTRRGLVNSRWQDEAEARKQLAWNNWEESLNLVVSSAENKDVGMMMDMLDRAINLLRVEHGKHFSYDHLRTAVEWFSENEELKRVPEFVKKFRLLFIDYDNDVICGGKTINCQNSHCRFRFIGEHTNTWMCPKCNRIRTLCMNTFRNHNGRCSSHDTTTKSNDQYYAFRESDLGIMYEKYVNDPDIVTSHRQIALIDTRINQLTSTTHGIDAEVIAKYIKSFQRDIARISLRLKKAYLQEDYETVVTQAGYITETAEGMFDMIDKARVDKASWVEMRELIKVRQGQVDVQVKREIAEHYSVSISAYIQGLTELAGAFVNRLNLVESPDVQARIRELVMGDTQRMLDAEIIGGEFILHGD